MKHCPARPKRADAEGRCSSAVRQRVTSSGLIPPTIDGDCRLAPVPCSCARRRNFTDRLIGLKRRRRPGREFGFRDQPVLPVAADRLALLDPDLEGAFANAAIEVRVIGHSVLHHAVPHGSCLAQCLGSLSCSMSCARWNSRSGGIVERHVQRIAEFDHGGDHRLIAEDAAKLAHGFARRRGSLFSSSI